MAKSHGNRWEVDMARKAQVLLSVLIIAIATLVLAPSASATTLYSNKGYYGPVNSVKYYNYAGASTNGGGSSNYSVVRNGSGNIPAGWSGGQASLYINGALCASSSLYYYPDATHGWTGLGGEGNCGTGNYDARGSTAAYNGNGYNYYYTFTTPYLSM